MNKIVLLFVLVFGSMTTQAQELTWETNVNKAIEVSNKTNKPLLLFFTGSDWCGWCIRLQKEVLKTPEFTKWANENVVLVELDYPRRTPQTAEIKKQNAELQQAFAYFAVQGVDELVLDLRYNGGGLIRVANQLSTQIAQRHLQEQVFVKYRYNDKNTAKNNTTLFSLGAGSTSLNLDRVFILTTASSCSSSELVINALSPFIDVVQIGGTTCGKPVGQQPDQIGNYVLFAINFQTVNALDQGDYFEGLEPECQVPEQINGDWGIADDPLYAEALQYIRTGNCSNVATSAISAASLRSLPAQMPVLAPWTVNDEH